MFVLKESLLTDIDNLIADLRVIRSRIEDDMITGGDSMSHVIGLVGHTAWHINGIDNNVPHNHD